jgi:N-methylhydantoinase A
VYPSKIPMIDIVTVGAGGGSIAWLSPESALKVGPRSAGAEPGPLCYGRGGTEPTVTDAHLVLGRIPPHLLGGEVPLDRAAAREGLTALGEKLGLELAATASGILEISAWNQANALRQITIQRGLDVRDFALTTFGGSGSLLLCRLIDIVGVPVGVVPRDPGNLSAFGLLTVDVKTDHVQTYVARNTTLDLAAAAAHFEALRARASAALEAEGFAASDRRFQRTADLRYFGQAFEVRVPVRDGPFDATTSRAAVSEFHDAHERLYGYCFRDKPEQEVEWVNVRVTGIGPIRRPPLRPLVPTSVAILDYSGGHGADSHPRSHGGEVGSSGAGGEALPSGVREVCFDAAGGFVPTPIFWRESLPPRMVVDGPAVIEEYGATVPLHPGFTATVDQLGNLVVSRAPSIPRGRS